MNNLLLVVPEGQSADAEPQSLNPEQVRAMNQELRTIIATQIEGKMYSRGLRENPQRDAIISHIYGRYLACENKPNENLFDEKSIVKVLEQAKKLAHLAKLINGDLGSEVLADLYKRTNISELLQQQSRVQDEDFSLSPESLLIDQKERGSYNRFWDDTFSKQIAKPTDAHEPERISQMTGVPLDELEVFAPGALPMNNKYFRATGTRWKPRPLSQITTVVCHESAGPTLAGAISTLQSRGLSYHFIIDKDGTIYQLQPIGVRAAHARGPGNQGGIGVCLVGGGSREVFGRATSAQQNSLAALTNKLKEKVPTLKNVMLHKEVSCNCTDCNAAGADMNQLAQRTGLEYNPNAL